MFKKLVFSAIGLAAFGAAGAATAANLIVDGGFETPAVTTPGYQSGFVSYFPGTSFGGPSGAAWTVTGSGSEVTLTNTGEYTDGPSYYDAHSGQQWLDLTGYQDNGSLVGVSQTIATTAGKTYTLSFWVGTAPDAESGVSVTANGASLGTFANPTPGVYGGNFVDWAQFSTSFVATGGSTTLDFTYAGGKSVSGLDDVSLTTPGVPEPASWALMLAGFGLAGAALRGRRSVSAL